MFKDEGECVKRVFNVTLRNIKKPKQFFFLGYFGQRVIRQWEVININLAKRLIVCTILFSYTGGDTTTTE